MKTNEEELLDEIAGESNDEIVGIAFRWSVAAILFVAMTAGLFYIFWPKSQNVEVVKPKTTDVIKSFEENTATLPNFGWKNVAADSGINYIHFSGATGLRLLPETMGGGVALFDFDNNGTLDVLFVSGTNWPGDENDAATASSLRLFANDGHAKFRDVTAEVGLECQIYGMGCAYGDYDNDGWLDLYVTCVGENRLYRNDQGKFVDVTAQSGVAGMADDWSSAAGFFDYDKDGLLDLLVCNYVRWSREIDLELNFTLNGVDRAYGPPTHYQGTQLYLFRNTGDGKFVDVAQTSGLHIINADRNVPVAKALAILLNDVNQDGWDDIVVANDTVRNFLLINLQNGKFEDQSVVSGIAYDRTGRSTGAMGIDMANIWNDDSRVIAIGNFANEMTSVYVSQADGLSFVDEASPLGIGAPTRQRLTFGTLWGDYDLDCRADLVQVNGHLEDTIAEIQPSQSYRQPAQLFWNKGIATGVCFAEVPAAQCGELCEPIVGRGGTHGDLDGDGDLDLVLTQIDGPPLVLINGQETGNRYLRIRLEGDGPNRFAYGARIEVQQGTMIQRHTISPTRSYLSQVELTATFGLGKSAETVEQVRVYWPDGRITKLDKVAVNQVLTVRPDGAGK